MGLDVCEFCFGTKLIQNQLKFSFFFLLPANYLAGLALYKSSVCFVILLFGKEVKHEIKKNIFTTFLLEYHFLLFHLGGSITVTMYMLQLSINNVPTTKRVSAPKNICFHE